MKRQRQESTLEGLTVGVEIFDYFRDMVIVVDNALHIIYLNGAATKEYRINRQKAIGLALTELYKTIWINPEDEQTAAALLEKNGDWVGESNHLKRDGEQIRVEVTAIVLTGEFGKRMGLIFIIRKVSD